MPSSRQVFDRDRPPGWDTNPSSSRQRVPLIGMALLGFMLSLVVGLSRFGVVADPWDPFFGSGSRGVSELPLVYAALGAAGFLSAAVAGAIGGGRRWQALPWVVVLFGLLAVLLAAGSVLRVILEPVLFDAWSTWSLLTALVAVLMLGPAMAEVLASLQFLKRVRAQGGSAWKALWGTPEAELASLQATAAGN
jgi:hypothetical protein